MGGNPRPSSAIVVGAGIGGLAAAIGLHRAGWRVHVLERAPALSEVGAGLSLWDNGVRALDWLGLGAELAGVGIRAVSRGTVHTAAGRRLRRQRADDPHVVMVHRAELHQILLRALPADTVRTGVTVTGVDGGGDRPIAHYRDGDGVGKDDADVLIGADGVHSAVRHGCWPDAGAEMFQGRTAWRGLTEPGVGWPITAGLTMGRGAQFGMLPLTDHRVYWFLTADADQPGLRTADEHGEVMRRVRGWRGPVRELVAATAPNAVLRQDLLDLDPLPTFVRDRVALLGDAAHAMTPDLGQGACQALEDAVVLAHRLSTAADVHTALAGYDADRRRRTQSVAAAARAANARNKDAGPGRYAAMMLAVRLMPARAWWVATARYSDWEAPA